MSTFKVNVIARNPKREELATPPVPALVDTGSELTWLPADVLKSVGITPRRKRMFATATQQQIERDVGYAILSAEGYETNDEVVFAEPGDLTLLGVRTLEGFGVMVDNIAHRFVATITLVANVSLNQVLVVMHDGAGLTPAVSSVSCVRMRACAPMRLLPPPRCIAR